MKKKLAALLMVTAMTLSLVACGGSESESKDTSADTTEKETTEGETGDTESEESTESGGEVVEIELWAPINEGTTAEESEFVRNVEMFNEEYADKIYVKLVCIGEDNAELEQKYQMAASAGNLPDLMEMNCGREFEKYIDAGHFANMSDYLGDEEFTSLFSESALTLQGNGRYTEETMYGLPTGSDVQGWFYNQTLFDQCGLEIPETFDDLLNCVKVFKENDIVPLMHGALDQWPLWGYWPWFSQLGFTQEANQWNDIADGSLKAADCEGLRKVFEAMQQLQEAGAYPENVANLNNTQAQETFMAGGAAMYCGGNWMSTEMDKCEIAEDIVFSFGPQFEDSVYDEVVAMRPNSWVFAFGSRIEDDEAKKEAVAAFMKWWFSEETALENLEKYGEAPAIQISDTSALDSLGPVSSQIAAAAIDTTAVSVIDPNSWCEYDGSVTVIWNAMTSIITGTIDADEALSQMQDWADRL